MNNPVIIQMIPFINIAKIRTFEDCLTNSIEIPLRLWLDISIESGTISQWLLEWLHNGRDGVLNHQPNDCLLNRLFKAQIKENIKAPRHWPLRRVFTGDRWIPRTKGQ